MKRKGILFDDIHSYRDLNLILSDANIPPAKPKTNYIDIPGSDMFIDATEELGEVKYESRECEFVFVVDTNEEMTFEEKKTQVSNALHGKRMRLILDNDDQYYYEGRVSVDEYKQKGFLRQITINALAYPYKLKNEITTIATSVSGTATITCPNDRKSVIPTVIADSEMQIVFGDITTTISAGEHIFPDIKFVEGDNVITCTGNGTITFVYQEGAL